MPERACALRISELTGRLDGLRARREELAIEEPEPVEPLSDEDLRVLQVHVRE